MSGLTGKDLFPYFLASYLLSRSMYLNDLTGASKHSEIAQALHFSALVISLSIQFLSPKGNICQA